MVTNYVIELESQGYEFASTLPRAFGLPKPISAMIAQAAAIGKQIKRKRGESERALICA